jgi:predicted RNA binding protein YcfA (HicA-like mRNA interferase family)
MTITPLLNKAVSFLNTTDKAPEISPTKQEEIVASSKLKLTSPLLARFETSGILTSEFRLSAEEEELLLHIVREAKLTPNITLLDLFVFDLKNQMFSLEKLVGEKFLETTVATLLNCYGNLLISYALKIPQREMAPMHEFLNRVVRDFIASSAEKAQSSYPADQVKPVSMENTRHVINTLNKRVSLFKSFLNSPAASQFFFKSPLSMVAGCEKVFIHKGIKREDIFLNNSLFLLLTFDVSVALNPPAETCRPAAYKLAENLRLRGASQGDISDSDFGEAFSEVKKWTPLFYKVYLESLPHYKKIALEYQAIQTEILHPKSDLDALKGMLKPLNPQATPEEKASDILIQFKLAGLIPKTFYLTPEESQLMDQLFTKYSLSSNVTLFDILGLAFYDTLEKISQDQIREFRDSLLQTRDNIASRFLQFGIGLSRLAPGIIRLIGPPSSFADSFMSVPKKFIERLDRELENLTKKIENTSLVSSKPSKKEREWLQKHQNQVLQAIQKDLVPLRDFICRLALSEHNHSLFLMSANLYGNASLLDQKTDGDRDCIQQYWNYIRIFFEHSFKKGYTGFNCDFDRIMGNKLPLSTPPKTKELAALRQKLAQAIFNTVPLLKEQKSAWKRALKGTLDHKTWLIENKLLCTKEKNQTEFLEHIFASSMTCQYYQNYLSGLFFILEKKIFPEEILPTSSIYSRAAYNFIRLDDPLPYPSHSPLSAALKLQIKKIANSIVISLKNHPKVKKFFDQHLSLVSPDDYLQWLNFFASTDTFWFNLWDNSQHYLLKLKKELIQDLRSQWSSYSSQELKAIDREAIKEAIFLEGLPLFRPVLILADSMAILEQQCIAEESMLIPEQLVNVLQLDGIDELLEELLAVAVAREAPQISIEPAPVVQELALPIPEKELPTQKHHSSAPRIAKKVAVVATKKPQIADEAATVDLAYVNKSREVLKKLKSLGFWEDRITGSHHVLKSATGGTVVVSNNPNLPKGTLKSIEQQAEQALVAKLQKPANN